jgi:hypothetical protein
MIENLLPRKRGLWIEPSFFLGLIVMFSDWLTEANYVANRDSFPKS